MSINLQDNTFISKGIVYMKKAILLLLLAFTTAFNAYTDEAKYKTLSDLNLRSDQSSESEIILVLHEGDIVKLIESSNGWSLVMTENGQQGYVADKYLKLVKNSDSSVSRTSPFITILILIVLIYFFKRRKKSKRYKYNTSLQSSNRASNKKSIIEESYTKSSSKKINKLLDKEELYTDVMRFTSNYYDDVLDEIKDGKLDWNNENCKMFFAHIKSQFKIKDKIILALIFNVKDKIEYNNYQSSLNLFNLNTFEDVIKETLLFDIFNNKKLNIGFTKRLLKETIGKNFSDSKIRQSYKKMEEKLKLEKFKDSFYKSDKSTLTLREQLVDDKKKELISKTIDESFSTEITDYVVDPTDYSRESRIDNYYKKNFSYLLTKAFNGSCCKCGQGMGTLEYDHFWKPKSDGGNFLMRHKDGYYINNCIPLCRSCNSSKGKSSYTSYFTTDELSEIISKSQSLNHEINKQMIDFYDDKFPLRKY